ncbi:hypothetical protein Sros01_81780 [Streptomyces roseochromogenus]|nr:hypothetical protein Sros01_81780 [Streptomyces roseochromogenus]
MGGVQEGAQSLGPERCPCGAHEFLSSLGAFVTVGVPCTAKGPAQCRASASRYWLCRAESPGRRPYGNDYDWGGGYDGGC